MFKKNNNLLHYLHFKIHIPVKHILRVKCIFTILYIASCNKKLCLALKKTVEYILILIKFFCKFELFYLLTYFFLIFKISKRNILIRTKSYGNDIAQNTVDFIILERKRIAKKILSHSEYVSKYLYTLFPRRKEFLF